MIEKLIYGHNHTYTTHATYNYKDGTKVVGAIYVLQCTVCGRIKKVIVDAQL